MTFRETKDNQVGTTENPRRRTLARAIPAEGENGLFSQSWYAVCQSSEVLAGKVLGTTFLNGRIVVVRGENGIAQVMSAYCPHLGADLAVGHVVGNNLRCAFHHWMYDQEGICNQTGVGDAPPAGARLFKFPTVEKYGFIWAFNGETPQFELPELSYPEEELAQKIEPEQELWNVDPWVACANTPDFQHLRSVHGMTLRDEDPTEHIEWTPHSFKYHLRASFNGIEVDSRIGIFGTNIFYFEGMFGDRWVGRICPFTSPAPGKTRMYHHVAVRRSEGDDASNAAFMDLMISIEKEFVRDDHPILQTAHFRPGTLTKSDRALAKYFEYVRNFPRAHPSAEFIR